MQLKRTVPFISESLFETGKPSFLIDNLEVLDSDISHSRLVGKLHDSLKISKKYYITSRDSILLVTAQYDTCLEYMFSHRFWRLLRETENKTLALGFLIETMHYLAAAPHRMANGIDIHYDCNDALTNLISKHTLEEHNHNIFFEMALKEYGCDSKILSFSRPLPTTFEWIYLMRFLSKIDPLCAILSSGLLEYTAEDQGTIKNWHTMLVDRNILNRASVNAIYEHVKLDYRLQHNSNWKNALKSLKFIECKRLCVCLNSIATIAEMYVRWLDSIVNGLSGDFVNVLSKLNFKLERKDIGSDVDYTFVSLPVFSSKIYDLVTHGGNISKKLKEVVSTSFCLSGIALENPKNVECSDRNFIDLILNTTKKTSKHKHFDTTRKKFIELVNESWLLAINGHKLWEALRENPSYSLVFGWIYENYYYISSIAQHVGPAIASCSDSLIRDELVKHLDAEIDHGSMLRKPLLKNEYGINIDHLRPLPTTLAFVGGLAQLASSNWKAYCLAMYYLQCTIKNPNRTFRDFYKTVADKLPNAIGLLDAIEEHDITDISLHHEDDLDFLLKILFKRMKITHDDVLIASTVAQLSWSFLDGIQTHYRNGDISVIQRLGWWK